MMDKRREKSANYTRNEKHLLLDKAFPYLDIIENKKTDTLTVEVKVRSWAHVASQYNAANPKGQRRVTQLKNLYENIKKRTKKDILIYQEELRVSGGKVNMKKIDDVGWRLVKTVPSLRALWKSTLIIKQKLSNNQEIPVSPVEEAESFEPSEMSPAQENVDYSVIIKEEYMPDSREFLTEEEIAEMTDVQNENQQSVDANNCSAQTNKNVNDVGDDIDLNFFDGRRENGFRMSDSLYETEREIKKRELEKLDLDIQMKKLEVEFMKGRLREQELNLKFRELEYDIKRNDFAKELSDNRQES